MLIELSTKEIRRMNRKTVLWVEKTLKDKKFGVDLYNILLRIRQLIEKPKG